MGAEPQLDLTVAYHGYAGSIRMAIPSNLLARARSGNRRAQNLVCILYKQARSKKTGHAPRRLIHWSKLTIIDPAGHESAPVAADVQGGCDCGCGGCDQGHHCGKPHFDCHK